MILPNSRFKAVLSVRNNLDGYVFEWLFVQWFVCTRRFSRQEKHVSDQTWPYPPRPGLRNFSLLFMDFARNFSRISQEFLGIFSGLSKDFLKDFSELLENFLRAFRAWNWLNWPCLFHEPKPPLGQIIYGHTTRVTTELGQNIFKSQCPQMKC